ncbi:hypothetical protein HDU82_003641 [Entophlyctis luteolus]|nr:hypothetical protein HDU82_003641 [Entophlyctis luteolus]
MSDPNNAILLACLAVTLSTIIVCIYRLQNAYTRVTVLLLVANIIYLSNNVVTIIYNNINWLNSPFRYFTAYFTIDAPVIIFYYLYIERLCILIPPNYARIWQQCMIFVQVLYSAACVCQITMFSYYGSWSTSGGYESAGPGLFELKMVVMYMDLGLATIILIMTTYAVHRILRTELIAENAMPAVVINSSSSVYWTMVTSDAAKFLVIVTVDVYKATGSVNPNVGALPAGNLGFSHLLDTIKVALMTAGLVAPALHMNKQSPARSFKKDDAAAAAAHSLGVSKWVAEMGGGTSEVIGSEMMMA